MKSEDSPLIENLEMPHLHQKRFWRLGLLACLIAILTSLGAHWAAQAQAPAWQQNLHCPPKLQRYSGIAYCPIENTNKQIIAYVIVIDLYDPGVGFEYVIARWVDRGWASVDAAENLQHAG